jgi:hypothetical protein
MVVVLVPLLRKGYKYNNQQNAKYKNNTTGYKIQPHQFQTTFPFMSSTSHAVF